MTDLKRVEKNSKIVLKYCEGLKNPKVIEFGGGKNRLSLPFKTDQLDYIRLEKDDIVADLENPLPIKDNSYDVIFSSSVFEHVFNIKQLFEECHRVLKLKGKLILFVPHFSGLCSIHLTHKSFFSADYFDIFLPDNNDFNFETTARFKIIERRITSPIKFLEPVINLNQRIYEGTIFKSLIPPRFVFVVMEVIK